MMLCMRTLLSCIIMMLCASTARAAEHKFTVNRTPQGGVEVKADGQHFASYVIDQGNKPYLWPIHGPTGKSMTRAFPMEQVEGEQRDHPHHRGITFSHDKIGTGTDTWTEAATYKPDHPHLKVLGSIKHREFTEVKADGDRAVIVEQCDYLDPQGKRLLSEQRRLTFRVIDDARVIDFDSDLIASDGDVKLADTKDAGLSIRVPTSMAVDTRQGGRIINSNGLTDAGAWAKSAAWCDYHGPVDGETLGVAMLNHPSSFRHPTPWHVRTYGLFTANPFASQAFDKSAPDKSIELKSGERLKLRHRFIFHKGDEKAARIAEAFERYAKEKASE
jgi:hypothetical protein